MSAAPWVRRTVPVVVALAVCVAFGSATVRPTASAAETATMASRFGFERTALNSAPPDAATQRPVAPQLEHIRAWISAVGAAVGLTDLRGLGRPADACLVDPRDDSVRLLPVPGAGGPAYAPVELLPAGLPYDATMAPMGCVPADVNADGAMDVTVYYWGRSPVMFLGRPGAGPVPAAADFRPVELVSPMRIWNTTALSIADVDGDGSLDVAVGNYFPDGARVLDPTATDDGRMQMQDGMGLARNAGTNALFLGSPTGVAQEPPVLTDASAAFPDESARSWTLAFGLQDLTGDLRPEIYVANDFGPDQLLVNHSEPGRVRFEHVMGRRDLVTPRSEVLGHDSFKGMGVTFSYDTGAELPTMVVSNITTPYALHESNFAFVPDTGRDEGGARLLRGELPYTERAEELGISRGGWAWDVKAGDFDNSGSDELLQATGFLQGETNRWPELQELAMGNDTLLHLPAVWPRFGVGDDLSGHEHNPFWARGADGRFHDLAPALGLHQPDVSRGLALGDVDGDGRLDALVANQWQDSVVLRNVSDAEPAAVLRVLRTGPAGVETDAIGAQLVWTCGDRERRTQLYPSNGHAGVSAAEVPLALPGGCEATVTVSWLTTDGPRSSTLQVPPGHHSILLDDDGNAVLR